MSRRSCFRVRSRIGCCRRARGFSATMSSIMLTRSGCVPHTSTGLSSQTGSFRLISMQTTLVRLRSNSILSQIWQNLAVPCVASPSSTIGRRQSRRARGSDYSHRAQAGEHARAPCHTDRRLLPLAHPPLASRGHLDGATIVEIVEIRQTRRKSPAMFAGSHLPLCDSFSPETRDAKGTIRGWTASPIIPLTVVPRQPIIDNADEPKAPSGCGIDGTPVARSQPQHPPEETKRFSA